MGVGKRFSSLRHGAFPGLPADGDMMVAHSRLLEMLQVPVSGASPRGSGIAAPQWEVPGTLFSHELTLPL